MFKIQEDHVRKILIVVLTVNAAMTNVSKDVKTTMTAHLKINVGTKSACPRNVKYMKIVDQATNALLKNVSSDVAWRTGYYTPGLDFMDHVGMAKNVLMTFVLFHQVIICGIYFFF